MKILFILFNLFNESYQILNSFHYCHFWTIYIGQISTFILFDILIVYHNGILDTNFQCSRAHFQIDHFKKKKQKSKKSIIALLFLNNLMHKNAGNNNLMLFFKYTQAFQKSSTNFWCKSKKGFIFLKNRWFNRSNDFQLSSCHHRICFPKITRNIKNSIKELKPSMLTENSSSQNIKYILGWSSLIFFISKHFMFLNGYQRRISQKVYFKISPFSAH